MSDDNFKHRLHVITTCAARKRGECVAAFRHTAGRTLEERAGNWLRQLDEIPAMHTAENLYQGDHWTVALDTVRQAQRAGFEVELWVISAGYGLIPATAPVCNYSATFSAHADRVCSTTDLPLWWGILSGWQGPASQDAPRSLEALGRANPADSFLVALGAQYLRAVQADLQNLICALRNPATCAVVCAGARCTNHLGDNLIPCSAQYQPIVGGPLVSLNMRVARRAVGLLRNRPLDVRRLREGMIYAPPSPSGPAQLDLFAA